MEEYAKITIETRRLRHSLPGTTLGWETSKCTSENNPHLGANLGGLFSFIQISKQCKDKHA
jgi:hypothetical protein